MVEAARTRQASPRSGRPRDLQPADEFPLQTRCRPAADPLQEQRGHLRSVNHKLQGRWLFTGTTKRDAGVAEPLFRLRTMLKLGFIFSTGEMYTIPLKLEVSCCGMPQVWRAQVT